MKTSSFLLILCGEFNGVFNFVFKKPNNDFDIRDLPETTRLERALKAHYLGGKAIYEMYGYFF